MIMHTGTSPEDFKIADPARWCPGCGNHAVLSTVQKILPETGQKKENIVFVSGIGCSSRFPYYINTYGFHGLHGRGAAIATGIKLANPHLSVWLITGDGDSMAIGGNHFIHLIRRNLDINVLLFNNKIYGLTKGQYSPTSKKGSITKTSPEGTISNPFIPGELAMGARASFFARVVDNDLELMKDVFIQAAKHKGTSVVEILQNCVIFNDEAHTEITRKDKYKENTILLKHGQPMLFGQNKEHGIALSGTALKVLRKEENQTAGNNAGNNEILLHDAKNPDQSIHNMLVRMTIPEYPVALGVIRAIETSVFEEEYHKLITYAKEKSSVKTVDDLLNGGKVFSL